MPRTAPARKGRVQVGSSSIRTEYLNQLRRAWKDRRLVFFLGAGVSAPYGLSNWTDLVLDLLLNESRKFEQFWPHYRKALALWMTDYFDFSPLALARVVKYKLRRSDPISDEQHHREFLGLVQESLYRTFTPTPKGTTALKKLAQIIKKSERARNGRRVPIVFTANFDNVLEIELKKLGVKARPIYDATRQTESELRIVHVHGYLPNEGPIPEMELVFTEDEYHRLSYSVFHWALADIISCLRSYTVLFIGLSMSDPNLRRLLDATYTTGQRPAHFLLRKDYDLTPAVRQRAIGIVEEYAREQAERANMQNVKTKSNISEAIDVMLKQAHEYDRELFKDMGVGTIWINDFGDIPKLLDIISS
jgi:hypothetical protein